MVIKGVPAMINSPKSASGIATAAEWIQTCGQNTE